MSVTLSIRTARVVQARVKHTATVGIALVAALAGADGLFAAGLTIGVNAARVVQTRVNRAPSERIALEARATSANGLISTRLTVGVVGARAGVLVARVVIATNVGVAGKAGRAATLEILNSVDTLGVDAARVAVAGVGIATRVGIAPVTGAAAAHGPVTGRATLGVLAAGIGETRIAGRLWLLSQNADASRSQAIVQKQRPLRPSSSHGPDIGLIGGSHGATFDGVATGGVVPTGPATADCGSRAGHLAVGIDAARRRRARPLRAGKADGRQQANRR